MTDTGPVTRLIEAVGLYISASEGWYVASSARPYNAQIAAEASLVRTNRYTDMIGALAACEGIEEWQDERSEGPYMNVPGGFRNRRTRWRSVSPWRRPDGSIYKFNLAEEKARMRGDTVQPRGDTPPTPSSDREETP